MWKDVPRGATRGSNTTARNHPRTGAYKAAMCEGILERTKTSGPVLNAYLLAIGLACAAPGTIYAQCTIGSTTGYTVTAHVVPVALVITNSVCPWGYNYNVRLAYSVEFSGTNVPANLWTLQGNVVCGNQSLFFNLPNSGGTGLVTTTSNPWRGIGDCATADVNSLSCFTVRLQINGPGIPNQNVVCAFSPLPVELVSFNAETTDGTVDLHWTTASETNSDRFVVERSSDGSDFQQILVVPAAGNSSSFIQYAAIDIAPLPGTSYYRLRKKDLDGKQDLGPVIVVQREAGTQDVRVFPNPNAGNTVNITGPEAGSELLLLDAAQALVLETTLWSSTVRLPELKPGIYLGVVRSPNGKRTTFRYVQQ